MTTATAASAEADYRAGRCADQSTARIRDLNDRFRRTFGTNADNSPGLYVTRGVSERGEDFQFRAVTRVITFDDFTGENDPHCEHDFGSFELDGETLFWKIDAYDKNLEYGSPDPSDAGITRRVLTVMLADEY